MPEAAPNPFSALSAPPPPAQGPPPANDWRQRHRIPEAGTRLASISTGGPW